MIQSCPISQNRVNTNIIRVISVLVAFTSLLFLLTSNVVYLYILFIDFSLRVFRLNSYSPYFQISFWGLHFINIKPKMSDEAPKRFALILGWVITTFMILFSIISMKFTITLALILLICATLEMLFEFCIGCKIYQYLKKFRMI